MSDDRSLGVTEARFGLSLLMCLSVALGYVVLQQLGASDHAKPLEVQAGYSTEGNFTADATAPIGGAPGAVVPVQGTEVTPPTYPYTSQRPQWLSPEQDSGRASQPAYRSAPSASDIGPQSGFDPTTAPAARSSEQSWAR